MFHVYECKPQLITAEAEIVCESDACEVERVRRIPDMNGSEKCLNDIENSLACLQKKSSITLDAFVTFLPTLTSPYTGPYEPTGSHRNFTDPFDDFIFSGAGSYSNEYHAKTVIGTLCL